MIDIEDETHVESTKFLHRKNCANRVFIGPWDIKAPPPPPPQPEQLRPIQQDADNRNSIDSHSNTNLLHDHTSSITAIRPRKGSEITNSTKSPGIISPGPVYDHTSSDGTSFVTARSQTHSSPYRSSVNSSYRFLERMAEQEDEDEIDYSLLVSSGNELIDTTVEASSSAQPKEDILSSSTDAESIKTIRPTQQNKGKLPMNQPHEETPPPSPPATATSSLPTNAQKKKRMRRSVRLGSKKKSLLWRKPGSAIVASRIPTIVTPEPEPIPTGKPIKIEPILCMRSVKEYTGSEPSRYKAAKEARYDLLTEKWRQVELVLTNSYISTYSSSKLYWPKKRLEHRIYLVGSSRPKKLELFLLSSLDYTFCLRYQSNSAHTPMMITHTFKARSFLKCQEWYMQLYDMLPSECKRATPQWCEVYIPVLDLSVNLPLSHIKDSNEVTMEVVKEAVISVLEEDGWDFGQHLMVSNGNNTENTENTVSTDSFGLCWTVGDRAEWVYWTHSSSDQNKRIDSVICPQSIEQTHRLELRMIEHTPHDIILPENLKLKEPPPVEGFLIQVSDFHGAPGVFHSNRKMSYFASFDQYLFYAPASKVEPPNTTCLIDEDLLPKNIRVQPYVSAVSPYTKTCTPEVEAGEVRRRMRLMIEAKGVIDLTEVSYVRRAFTETIDDEQDIPSSSNVSLLHWPTARSSISQKKYQPLAQNEQNSLENTSRKKPCLEIIMTNGLQIKFEAYSSDTCDLWVSYLAQIIVYWKARKEAEKDAHSLDNFASSACNIGSISETDSLTKNNEIKISQKKQKQLADTRIWSYCFYEQCRDVVKSGILYYKPHKRGSYSQKIFILTSNGWILFYDVYNRNSTKKSCNHERKGTLDIAGSYFYSGVDCSKKKKGSNQDNLIKKSARIYRNGLSTDDDTLSCIFSIWKPKLRRYFSTQRQRLRVYHRDQRLNPNGSTWTFLAPSRREKEEWVCALNTVTEHMIRSKMDDRLQPFSCK